MEKKLKEKNLPSCCKPTKEYKGNNPLIGIAYGIIPHIGCIMFIIGAVLGVTILMQYFRPFLMNRYIFHYLILLSVGFATLSSFLYLRKNKLLSWKGIKKKKGYLAIMYGSTIGINLLLFFLVFPFLANFSLAGTVVFDGNPDNLGIMSLKSDIPCPGHAPLISNELKTIEGVVNVKYSFPNNFEVQYDKSRTSTNDMLSLEVFDEYPATLISDSQNTQVQEVQPLTANTGGSCSGGCGGSASCGGGCGSPSCSLNK